MELRDKIPGMSFVKINIINILAKGIKLIILSEGIIKLQHSEAVVKNSQWHKWQYNHLGNYVMWMKSIAIFNTHGLHTLVATYPCLYGKCLCKIFIHCSS